MNSSNKKTAVSVLLDQPEYVKLKKLSEIESRSMASYIRNVINEKYQTLTPLEKQILSDKEDIRA